MKLKRPKFISDYSVESSVCNSIMGSTMISVWNSVLDSSIWDSSIGISIWDSIGISYVEDFVKIINNEIKTTKVY